MILIPSGFRRGNKTGGIVAAGAYIDLPPVMPPLFSKDSLSIFDPFSGVALLKIQSL
jgi:hypothetical protein